MNFELVVATSNKHKLEEIRAILSPHKITVYGISDLNLTVPEVIENGETYFDNALIKARALQEVTSMPLIADDSGLEVLAMDNKPGIHTARFASENGGHDKAMDIILKEVANKDRRARFITDIVLLNVEDKPMKFEGIVEGTIALTKEGTNGFGYDPIFISDELNKCYALLTSEEKNRYSHRAKALKKLLTYLKINGYAK